MESGTNPDYRNTDNTAYDSFHLFSKIRSSLRFISPWLKILSEALDLRGGMLDNPFGYKLPGHPAPAYGPLLRPAGGNSSGHSFLLSGLFLIGILRRGQTMNQQSKFARVKVTLRNDGYENSWASTVPIEDTETETLALALGSAMRNSARLHHTLALVIVNADKAFSPITPEILIAETLLFAAAKDVIAAWNTFDEQMRKNARP